MLLKLLIQALNYCKHKIMICQEAMAGTHSLNVALNLLSIIANDLLNLRSNWETKFQILVEVSTKRESCSPGVCLQRSNEEPNCGTLL